MKAMLNILDSAKRAEKKNIIIFSSGEEKFVRLLAKLPHKFLLWTEGYDFRWNEHIPKPDNVLYLPQKVEKLPDIPANLIIFNDRLKQLAIVKRLRHQLHVNDICVDHSSPPHTEAHPIGQPYNVDVQAHSADSSVSVGLCESAVEEWRSGSNLVRLTADLDTFKPLDNCEKQFIGCPADTGEGEFNLLRQLAGNNPVARVRVHSSDMNTAVEYNQCKAFVVMRQGSVCVDMVEALACGLPVITFSSADVTTYVTNMHNGILCHDFESMSSAINNLAGNENLLKFLGQNARQLMETQGHTFHQEFSDIIEQALELPYKR